MTTVSVNRKPGRETKCKRGFRQGDPLSPLLFVQVAGRLNMMFRNASQEGLIQGIGGLRPESQVINLQYADDTIVFDTCDVAQAMVIKMILCCFEIWSGLALIIIRAPSPLLSNDIGRWN